MNHVPAQSHIGVDSLSRRRRMPKDTEDEDAEEYLDKFMGSAQFVVSPPSSVSLVNFLSSQALHAFRPTRLDSNFFRDLLLTMRRTPRTPYASFCTTSITEDLLILSMVDPTPPWATELHRIKQARYDPSEKDSKHGSLVKYSLLSVTDNFSYTGHEFEHQRVCIPILAECNLGGETFSVEVFQYFRSYMSSLKEGVSHPTLTDESGIPGIPDPSLHMDNRLHYEDVPPLTNVTCATHSFGIQDKDSPEMWQEIITYLKTDSMPMRCENAVKRKLFIRKTKNFFLHNEDRLWKIEPKGKIPRLVVIDLDRRLTLIAEAHNDIGIEDGTRLTKPFPNASFGQTCSTKSLILFVRATFVNLDWKLALSSHTAPLGTWEFFKGLTWTWCICLTVLVAWNFYCRLPILPFRG